MGERVMGADAARAVGRFNPDGPDGYRAASAPNAPLRRTRAEAVEDERAWLDGREALRAACAAMAAWRDPEYPRTQLREMKLRDWLPLLVIAALCFCTVAFGWRL